jgi:putative colanic acid biosysnthesis UDP-glucose lipid carrier transferase
LQGQTAFRKTGAAVAESAQVVREVPRISVVIEIIGDVTPIRPRRAGRSRIVHSERSPLAFAQRVLDPVLVALLVPVTCFTLGAAFSQPYRLLASIAFLLAISVFRVAGLYRRSGRNEAIATSGRITAAWAGVAAVLAAVGYITGSIDRVSGDVLLAWGLAVPVVLTVSHIGVDAAMRALRTRGFATRTAVVVGAGPTAREFAQRLMDAPGCGIRLVGFFDDHRPSSSGPAGLPILGSLASLPDYVKDKRVDHIYITLPVGGDGRVARLKERLLDTTASVSFLPQVLAAGVPNLHIEEVAGVPLFTSCDTPFADCGRRLVKRASDLTIAAGALLIAAPIMVVVAIAVKLSSPGPILFRQRRHGLDGKEIVVYKFRTMKVMPDGTKVEQAQRNDPRVTRLGRFLRSSSLDELPQLVNVLQGRMSMIGPRPHAVVHNDHYRQLIAGYARRHKIKPGLSGWAQVHGCRGETKTVDDMRARVEHDLYYLRNWSLGLDLRIAVKTLLVLLRDPKAY